MTPKLLTHIEWQAIAPVDLAVIPEEQLRFDRQRHKLLTVSNTKIDKSNSAISKHYIAIMHLAPSWLSGMNACAYASSGCALSCLNTAGRGVFTPIQIARIRRTRFFQSHKGLFLLQLIKEIKGHIRRSHKLGRIPTIRLNGTSDYLWEKIYPELFTMFPHVTWYDYTKYPYKFRPISKLPTNYDLTFSRSESNHVDNLYRRRGKASL